MLPTIITLLLCQHLSITSSTRLPLEVYELTSATAAHDLHYFQQQQQQQHKNLEYATINANQQQQENDSAESTTVTMTSAATAQSFLKATTIKATSVDVTANSHQQLDRRRSRQMLDDIQQQHQQQQQNQQHRPDHTSMQHHLHHSHQQQKFPKDVRVLYQVGESEDDLPVCAPNAVCSKIDLYETPWIERQCRCPKVANNHANNIIIHHHNNNQLDTKNYIHKLKLHSQSHPQSQQQQQHNEKYHSYFEQEKFLQHNRLLLSADFISDKHFENVHLKKLMQKLGAVYEDDLDLEPNDFLETNEDADIRRDSPLAFDDSQNENGFLQNRKSLHADQQQQQHHQRPHVAAGHGAHMRHSAGHGGSHGAKEASYIGGCPSSLGIEDGHTIADKTRHYKLCNPVHKLPVCKHFRDYTWTLTTSAELNVTEQIVHCRCPRNSVTYLTKREPAVDGAGGFAYLFACSPVTRIRCQRKEPCKLFTVRKRQEFLDEVNINVLCQCPKGHHCPSHHTQGGVIPGESFLEDNIQTYSGYCMSND